MTDNPSGISRRKALKGIGATGALTAGVSVMGTVSTSKNLKIYVHRARDISRSWRNQKKSVIDHALDDVFNDGNPVLGDFDDYYVISGDHLDGNFPADGHDANMRAWMTNNAGKTWYYNKNEPGQSVHVVLVDHDPLNDPSPTKVRLGKSFQYLGNDDGESALCYANIRTANDHGYNGDTDDAIVLHEMGHCLVNHNYVDACDNPGDDDHALGSYTVTWDSFEGLVIDKINPMSAFYVMSSNKGTDFPYSIFKAGDLPFGDLPNTFSDGKSNGTHKFSDDILGKPDFSYGKTYASITEMGPPQCGDSNAMGRMAIRYTLRNV